MREYLYTLFLAIVVGVMLFLYVKTHSPARRPQQQREPVTVPYQPRTQNDIASDGPPDTIHVRLIQTGGTFEDVDCHRHYICHVAGPNGSAVEVTVIP